MIRNTTNFCFCTSKQGHNKRCNKNRKQNTKWVLLNLKVWNKKNTGSHIVLITTLLHIFRFVNEFSFSFEFKYSQVMSWFFHSCYYSIAVMQLLKSHHCVCFNCNSSGNSVNLRPWNHSDDFLFFYQVVKLFDKFLETKIVYYFKRGYTDLRD